MARGCKYNECVEGSVNMVNESIYNSNGIIQKRSTDLVISRLAIHYLENVLPILGEIFMLVCVLN